MLPNQAVSSFNCKCPLEAYIFQPMSASQYSWQVGYDHRLRRCHHRLTDCDVANPEDEQRRARLKREIETLQKAQEHLEGLTEDEQ